MEVAQGIHGSLYLQIYRGAASLPIRQGERFSQNYIVRGEPTSDSQRMRRRVYRLFMTLNLERLVTAEHLELRLGVEVPGAIYGYDWEEFFIRSELRDFLDTLTIVFEKLRNSPNHQERWRDNVDQIFREECVRYRIAAQGGVHFSVDGEFEHNQACAIAALQPLRYQAARTHFEAGQRALDGVPPQTRDAIRQTFECVETIFRLMFPDVSQLGSVEINKKLKPALDGCLQGPEKNAISLWIKGFAEWVNGAHQYRHGQGVEEPNNPSIATAVLSISLGASYARWLAEVDSGLNAGGQLRA